MADEPQVPAQPEGAGQPTKKRPSPVNLAMVEAAERGLDLNNPPPPPKPASKAAKEAPPAATPPPPLEPAPEPPSEAAESASPASDEESASVSEGSPAPAAVESADPAGELATLSESANQKRLSPRDEDRATALLRACISGGQVAAALAAVPKLPWILGVRGIEQAWPQLSPDGRAQLLESLASMEGEHAIRLRLSVARSLAKIDPPVGLQLAGAVCRAMWDTENGALSTEHSKLVGNVFLGRGKPWVLQLSLEGLDPADAQAVVSAVVFSAFNVNNPPITQLSILRYAGSRLNGLHPNLLAMVAKGVSRWSGKWQDSLRKEVPELPEVIATALKPGRSDKGEREPRRSDEPKAGAPAAAEDSPEEEEGEIPLPPELEEKLKIAVESGDPEAVAAVTLEANAWRDAQSTQQAHAEAPEPEVQENDRKGDKRRRGRDRDRDRDRDRERPADRKERPVYVSREQEAASKGQGPFNLSATLKQIEGYVTQLRNELGATQAKLRKAETSPRKAPDKVLLSVEEANLSPEELKRLVVQLERRNAELQTRVEELLADSETRALATSADADVTVQYRTLLKLKLQEDYSDYLALEKNAPEFIVQQHYRALIRHVFGIMREEGVALEGDLPPPPPEPLPPPPPPPVIEDEEEEEDSPLDRIDPEPDAEPAEAEHVEEPIDEPMEEAESVDEEPAEEVEPASEVTDQPDEPETASSPEDENERSK